MTHTKNSAYRQIKQPMIVLLVCASSMSAQAALLSDSSERRIQIRHGSNTDSRNAYISPSTSTFSHSPAVTISSGANTGDSMQGLIAQKQREFVPNASISIQENKQVSITRRAPTYNSAYYQYNTANNTYNGVHRDSNNMDFNAWLNSNSYRAQQVAEYQRYLTTRVGAQNVPPLSQLLTTARSWDKCGYEPYQLPPQELWANIVPTLRLYTELKNQGVIPATSEIRSVYRSPGLNDCAGGADSSKHMNGSAMDIWVPEYENNLWQRSTMQDGLCQFWQYQGQEHNFGLGLYATGAVHLDTDGYRKWGFHHASSSSSCRY